MKHPITRAEVSVRHTEPEKYEAVRERETKFVQKKAEDSELQLVKDNEEPDDEPKDDADDSHPSNQEQKSSFHNVAYAQGHQVG
jgi:hypothetical protein